MADSRVNACTSNIVARFHSAFPEKSPYHFLSGVECPRRGVATTDGGVILYRKLLRREIRLTARGGAPMNTRLTASDPVATYCHNTVIVVPPTLTPEADRALCFAFGREVTRRILAGDYPKDTLGAAPRAALEAFDFPPAT